MLAGGTRGDELHMKTHEYELKVVFIQYVSKCGEGPGFACGFLSPKHDQNMLEPKDVWVNAVCVSPETCPGCIPYFSLLRPR